MAGLRKYVLLILVIFVSACSSDLVMNNTANKSTSISLLAGYTPAFQKNISDGSSPDDIINQMVSDLNLRLSNSNIPVTVKIVGIIPTTYKETLPHLDYERLKGNQIANLSALREKNHADIVVLLTDEYPQDIGVSCGYTPNHRVQEPDAYTIVAYSTKCPLKDAHFSREVANLFGAEYAIDPQYGSLPYARGYSHYGEWRTTMTHHCKGQDCPMIQNFSNPNVLHYSESDQKDVPTGAADHNNSRVITEYAPIIDRFGMPRKGWAGDVKLKITSGPHKGRVPQTHSALVSAVLDGKLYLFYKGASQDYLYGAVFDGKNWTGDDKLSWKSASGKTGTFHTSYPPAVTQFLKYNDPSDPSKGMKPVILMNYIGPGNNYPVYTTIFDGQSWTQPELSSEKEGLPSIEGLHHEVVTFNNIPYAFVTDAAGKHLYYLTYEMNTAAGTYGWVGPLKVPVIPSYYEISEAPGVAVSNNELHILYKLKSGPKQNYHIALNANNAWVNYGMVFPKSYMAATPSMASYHGDLYALWYEKGSAKLQDSVLRLGAKSWTTPKFLSPISPSTQNKPTLVNYDGRLYVFYRSSATIWATSIFWAWTDL
ncbi:MAG: hypothetical protein KDI61_01315 [Alphaproteobacteria bacterium]|nr:hypothetical protein [Alphaproteobacteria bacterium]